MEDIYEVQVIGAGIWVTEDVYNEIKRTLEDLRGKERDDILGRSIEFNSLSGQVHLLMLHTITGVNHSTREQRKKQQEIYMQYQQEMPQQMSFMMPVVKE